VREDTQNRVGKELTQIQDMSLCKEREKWRRLCHKTTHSDGNISGGGGGDYDYDYNF
jgi:hypothetical protein